MEIERKFLVKQIPEGCTSFPCRQIEQAYLNTDPVVRIRRDNDDYYLTYKGKGLLSREEYKLALNKEAYEHLLTKADGIILTKKRYMIPVPGNDHLTIELDVFEGQDVYKRQHNFCRIRKFKIDHISSRPYLYNSAFPKDPKNSIFSRITWFASLSPGVNTLAGTNPPVS